MRRVLMMVVLLALAGGSLAYASVSVPSTRTLVAVPKTGTRHSVFRVRLASPTSTTYRHPEYYIATVSLEGRHPAGCVFTRTARASLTARTVALRTGTAAKSWCEGTFSGVVYVEERGACGPIILGPGPVVVKHEVCPQTAVRPALTGGPVGPATGTVTTPVTTTTSATPTTTTNVTTTTLTTPPVTTLGAPVELGTFSFRVR